MKEEALSPVVAFMLLLMIVVSIISLLNAYYIPSLKQQAEIEHLYNVEQSFLKLSSDILQIVTFRDCISMKVPVQLGGGGVDFSPIKSSGYLEINTILQNEPLVRISLNINNIQISSFHSEINRTKIIFRPVGNFWINQGYEWEDGMTFVRKGIRKTYLQYADDVKALQDRSNYYDMLSPRIKFEEYQNNITTIKIDIVNIENPESNRSYSSNGEGAIFLDWKETKFIIPIKNKDKFSFEFTGSNTNHLGFNSKINNLFTYCLNKNNVLWDSDNYTLTITQNPVPDLLISRWNLSFHV